MVGLFLAAGTEGLSNSSRPWAGGQVADVPCVGWEPSDTRDHHNGSEVTDAITCHGGVGDKAPQRSVRWRSWQGLASRSDSAETSEAERRHQQYSPLRAPHLL